jgi:hypothetical protein
MKLIMQRKAQSDTFSLLGKTQQSGCKGLIQEQSFRNSLNELGRPARFILSIAIERGRLIHQNFDKG